MGHAHSHKVQKASDFVWDVCHTPLWSNGYFFENNTKDTIVKIILEEKNSKTELLLLPAAVKSVMLKSSFVFLSAAFYKKEHTSNEEISKRVTGLSDEPHPPEHLYYVFKRRHRMESGATFCALKRHAQEFKVPENKIDTADTFAQALAEYDRRAARDSATVSKASASAKKAAAQAETNPPRSILKSGKSSTSSTPAKAPLSDSLTTPSKGEASLPRADSSMKQLKPQVFSQEVPPMGLPDSPPSAVKISQGSPERPEKATSTTDLFRQAELKETKPGVQTTEVSGGFSIVDDSSGASKSSKAPAYAWGVPELGPSTPLAGKPAGVSPAVSPDVQKQPPSSSPASAESAPRDTSLDLRFREFTPPLPADGPHLLNSAAQAEASSLLNALPAPIEMPAIWAAKYGIPLMMPSSPMFPTFIQPSVDAYGPVWGIDHLLPEHFYYYGGPPNATSQPQNAVITH